VTLEHDTRVKWIKNELVNDMYGLTRIKKDGLTTVPLMFVAGDFDCLFVNVKSVMTILWYLT
jgi:hypothetical protein